MRTNLFGGAVLGLLCLASSSFAGWDANDKALGHEGNKMSRSNRTYYAQPARQVYRSAPIATVRVAPAPMIVAAPAAAPQVAATNSNTERRSFSVEPGAAPAMNNNTAQNNTVYSAPRSYNSGSRAQRQPSWSQADTKILGREGN
jgi:hypothetical protein